MGWKACHHDHSSASRYALCSSIRYNIKQTYGLDFAPGSSRHVEIPPFYGDESEQEADQWIGAFEAWAVQENLNSKKKIQLIQLGLFGEAYEWARDLNLEKAKWKEFVALFRERFAGDPTPWAGIPFHENQHHPIYLQ